MSFLQHHGEAAASEADALFDATSHGHFGSIAWNTKALAEDPHVSRPIIDLKDSIAYGSKRTRRSPGDGDILAGIAAWVFVYVGDAGAIGTSCDSDDYSANRREKNEFGLQ